MSSKNIEYIIKLILFTIIIGFITGCSQTSQSAKIKFNSFDNSICNNKIELEFGRKLIDKDLHDFVNQKHIDRYETDTTPQRILLIGDSMSKWLRYRLQDYCEENNHKLNTVTWVSGNTEWFANSDTLNYFIERDSISYVILVLGANELFIKDFALNRGRYVDKITERLSGVKWVWVGPPNWKNDTGINDFLADYLGTERFFLSNKLKFERQEDGMHPTVSSCSMWTDSISSWIMNKSISSIKLNTPKNKRKLIKPKATLLFPL